jgi:hypothetical protein
LRHAGTEASRRAGTLKCEGNAKTKQDNTRRGSGPRGSVAQVSPFSLHMPQFAAISGNFTNGRLGLLSRADNCGEERGTHLRFRFLVKDHVDGFLQFSRKLPKIAEKKSQWVFGSAAAAAESRDEGSRLLQTLRLGGYLLSLLSVSLQAQARRHTGTEARRGMRCRILH